MTSSPASHQPAIRPFVVGLVLVLLIVFGAVNWQSYQSQFVYALEVDGELLGYLEAREDWLEILQETQEWAQEQVGLPVVLESEVSLTRVRPDEEEAPALVLTRETLAEVCRSELHFVTGVWALAVNGLDVAFLGSREEAEAVVTGLIEDYRAGLAARGNTVVLEASIAETFDIHWVEVTIDQVVDVERAKRILLRGTDKTEVHIVTRGESLWSIAGSNSLTVQDLRRANPEVAGSDLIRVGQKLNLIVPDPYVTLESTERFTYIRYLPFAEQVKQDPSRWPWESHVQKAGVRGRNEVVVSISRINGEEVSRTPISEKRLSDPSTQIYILGTKTHPVRSGGLIWPVQGRITSNYGWRGREFHRGIDIGAPLGTPVLAAKGGTVTFVGRSGGLGNLIKIDHGGGLETWYAHLSNIAVSVGQAVGAGDTIGRVGSTGRSTGPHLHFETRLNGESVNPVNYYPRGG